VAVLFSGCASQGINTFKYKPAEFKKVLNEIEVNKPYSDVWDNLVREISKSFYIINNIDKESRIINLSFSSNNANYFIDCGISYRTYKLGNEIEEFTYNIAEKSMFKFATKYKIHFAYSEHIVTHIDPILEGIANIYIAPSNINNSTILTVNVRYVLSTTIKNEAFGEHVNGLIIPRGRLPETHHKVGFNTNQIGYLDMENRKKVSCISNGRLEKEIIEMIADE